MTGELEVGGFISVCVFFAVFAIPIFILLPRFIRLGKINKSIESLCGNPIDLSILAFQGRELSKAEIKLLKKEKRCIKKTKLAWHYSPDKIESWLESMEENGFNLIKMSKLGASFYFLKGSPRKVKYCVDYQNKTNPEYFNLHKDNGWKLFFTSITRFQAFCVWGQEYTDEPPVIYNDKQGILKHAKRLALTYSLTFLPISVIYVALLIWWIKIALSTDSLPVPMLSLLILYPVIIIEYSVFAIKTICYYLRIKKSLKNGNNQETEKS